MALRSRLGPILYGALFAVALPLLLAAWAVTASPGLPLPAVHEPLAGGGLAAAGVALMAWAMLDLWRRGGGLPMNAFPPPRLVEHGAYALAPHPIYAGFVLAVGGVALATGSPGGLWLVTPAVALASAALVLGHERHDLTRRFGRLPRPWLSVPPPGGAPPAWRERSGALALVLGPWLVLYAACARLGAAPDARSTLLPLERGWPVLAWAWPVYASVYLLVPAAFLASPSQDALRRLTRRGLASLALVFPLYLLLPLTSPPRAFEGGGLLGPLVLLERAADTAACAFPSYHVIWALLAAQALAPRRGWARALAWGWAWAVAAACLAVGAHSLADVAAGVLTVALLGRGPALWEALRAGAERLANGWRDWRVGPARLIVHGLFAGLAAGAGVALLGAALGPGSWRFVLAVWAAGLLGAGLWAQVIEGRGLSRPFGFYGAQLGMAASLLWARRAGFEPLLVLAAGTLCAPATQAIGRLRCLVQGCCHGAPAPEGVGIRQVTPLSRVVRAGLGGVPLHPTALYSILWNLVVGAVLLRLVALGAPATLVAGSYLVLGGAGRFVEESWRGEPQTPRVAGLRLYQWLAAASLVAGAAVTAVGPSAPLRLGPPDAGGWGAAALAFAVSAVAMGVDFPASARRLSRLA